MKYPDNLLGSVGFVLNKLAQRSNRLAEGKLSAVGLQPRHVGVLMTVDERGPQSQKAIGEAMAIDRTTMVQLADTLEAQGLVERRPDPADRRASLLSLTDQGRDVLVRASQVVKDAEAELLHALSTEDRRKLLGLMVRALGDE
jgi:DNA-binding MarR family transcriptional regulator